MRDIIVDYNAMHTMTMRLSDSSQSNPLFKDYYLIIVAFSSSLFSIYDIFYI